jgi:hypothetical protein
VDADQGIAGSLRTVLLRGPLIVSAAELVSTGPNGTYPAHVISR